MQIYQICLVFFQYDIVTVVKVNFPEYVTAPATELCFYRVDLLKDDKAQNILSHIQESVHMKNNNNVHQTMKFIRETDFFDKMLMDTQIFDTLTIQQTFDMTYGISDLNASCIVGDSEKLPCEEMLNIRHFMYHFLSCFAFDYNTNLILNYLETSRGGLMSSFISDIMLSSVVTNVSSAIIFKLNRNKITARPGFSKHIAIFDPNHIYSMSYSEVTNNLLPYPYVTHCVNYEDGMVTDRGTCFEQCVLRESLSSWSGYVFPGFLAFKNDRSHKNNKILTYSKIVSNGTLMTLYKRINDLCNTKCRNPSCTDTFYIPEIQTTVTNKEANFIMYILQSPKIETVCDQKLGLLQFITNIASTFGFWIGVSMYDVIEPLSRAIQFLQVRFNKQESSKCVEYKRGKKSNIIHVHPYSSEWIKSLRRYEHHKLFNRRLMLPTAYSYR